MEVLSLIAYRQPITRGEIEEVRGVAVSTNIVRTILERGWVRVVGHRDVPGKPAMLGTTKRFLDYFGLKRLDELPSLSEIKDLEDLNAELALPEPSPQSGLLDELEEDSRELIEQVGVETELPDEKGGDVVSLAHPEVN